MDYLGLGSLIVGILFYLTGVAYIHIPENHAWVEELAGFIALVIGFCPLLLRVSSQPRAQG
jgi:hypothetical protein